MERRGERGADRLVRGERVPLAVGWRRQDMVDNTSSAFAGHLTLGADPRLTQRVRDADVLLVIGDRLSEITTAGYTLLRVPNPEQALLHVSPDPDELGRVYAPTLAIPASPDAFALALSALPPLDGTARQGRSARPARTTSTISGTFPCRAR